MISVHLIASCGQALRFLESDELEKEVNDMCTAARSKGITGVPITIIDSKWAVTGGQSADVYVQVSSCLSVTLNCSINVADFQETRRGRYLCCPIPHAFRSSGDRYLHMTASSATDCCLLALRPQSLKTYLDSGSTCLYRRILFLFTFNCLYNLVLPLTPLLM